MLNYTITSSTYQASRYTDRKEIKKDMSRPQTSGVSPLPVHHESATSETIYLISEGELCLDLINSEHFDYRGREEPQDNLERPEWIQAFSRRWHLPIASPPGAFELTSLRVLRTLLRQMFEATTTEQLITDAQIEELNTFLALTPMMQQAQRMGNEICLQTLPLQTGWTAVLTQSAASWIDLLARTPSGRLKVCANPACYWVFVDHSHNQSRRWCRQVACGNLIKVRHYRAQRSKY
jgi:predicted RNA-binding Zn ribbon-like protein